MGKHKKDKEKQSREPMFDARRFTYRPGVNDHELQQKVTLLMHKLVKGTCTLANMGYLHMNTLGYNPKTGNVQMRVYFDARLATRVNGNSVTSKTERCVIEPFKRFQNYLFVGNPNQVFTYEEIAAPKVKIVTDEAGNPSIKINDEKFEKIPVAIMHCNVPIAMSAIHDHSVLDPELMIRYDSVGNSKKHPAQNVIQSGNADEFPVVVNIAVPNNDLSYDPTEAVAFLRMVMEARREAGTNRRKLEEKISAKAKEKRKVIDSENSKLFNKLS